MKKMGEVTYYTIGEVSSKIKRSAQTIKNWYKWCDAEKLTLEEAGLPEYRKDLDAKGTMYFNDEAIGKLKKFRDNISYGQMSDFNARNWGKRGQAIKESKNVEENKK